MTVAANLLNFGPNVTVVSAIEWYVQNLTNVSNVYRSMKEESCFRAEFGNILMKQK